VNIPTIKSMVRAGFTPEQAQKIRTRIERYYRKHPFGDVIPHNCLEDISAILDQFGHETIQAGSNARSPRIDYVNTGDTYSVTILFVRGKFRVGDWGSIVERGNYA